MLPNAREITVGGKLYHYVVSHNGSQISVVYQSAETGEKWRWHADDKRKWKTEVGPGRVREVIEGTIYGTYRRL